MLDCALPVRVVAHGWWRRAGCEADAASFVDDKRVFHVGDVPGGLEDTAEASRCGRASFVKEHQGDLLCGPSTLPSGDGTVVVEASFLVANCQRCADPKQWPL